MPSFQSILKEAAKAIKKPAVLEAGERGTGAAPAMLDPALVRPAAREFSPGVPVAGVPEVAQQVNVTAATEMTTADRIQALKTHLGGLIRRDPNLPKDVQEKLYRGSWRKEAANEVADLDIGQWFSPLKRDPVSQTKLVHNYMVTEDEVAQAMRYGKTHIRDIPIETWQESARRLQEAVDLDPEVQEALKRIRGALDEQFEDMATRQWIDRNRYLGDYTPIRRINASLDGLASFFGEDAEALKSRLLAAQQKRTGAQTPREVDLIKVFRATRAEYLRKVAEHETALDLFSDPTINLTEHFAQGQALPRDVAVVRTGAGMFGATIKANEGYFIDGALRAMDPKGHLNLGGFVVPKPVAEAIGHFNRPVHSGAENWWYKSGTNIAKMLTVYNPANTMVNLLSDAPVAMFVGPESHPLGFLKWAGRAYPAAVRGARGKGGTHVKLHGRTVDVWDMAVREGITSGTIAAELGSGVKLPPELARLYPEAERNHANWLARIARKLETSRLAVEAGPRIAAGLEAVERTGDWSKFGQVGRDITFRYGAGAPRVSQFPAIRMISPFLQFQGLATARVLDLANAKSLPTKARIAIGLAAVPLSAHMWNHQNDEYKQVELALPEYERNQLHIVVPDPTDPSKPRRDIEGQPVVLRFRYWVPEQVLSTVGLGNLATRAERTVTGRDTPMQFLSQTVKGAGESISNMLVLPSIVQEAVTGKTERGPMSGTDWVNRIAPITRIATKAVERGQDYGPAEGAKTAVLETAGARFARARHVDVKLLDAQLQEAVRKMNESKGRFRSAARNRGGSDVAEAKKTFLDAVAEVKRLKAQIAKEKAGGYAPPKADKARSEKRRESVRKTLKEGE